MESRMLSTQQTKEYAIQLASVLKPGSVLTLKGDLGSGKTTFTSYLVEALGFNVRVQSPTFVIQRIYKKNTQASLKRIYHLDLYRLTDVKDCQELGMHEMFEDENGITIIEWPDVASELLPTNTIKLEFKYIDENIRDIHRYNN